LRGKPGFVYNQEKDMLRKFCNPKRQFSSLYSNHEYEVEDVKIMVVSMVTITQRSLF